MSDHRPEDEHPAGQGPDATDEPAQPTESVQWVEPEAPVSPPTQPVPTDATSPIPTPSSEPLSQSDPTPPTQPTPAFPDWPAGAHPAPPTMWASPSVPTPVPTPVEAQPQGGGFPVYDPPPYPVPADNPYAAPTADPQSAAPAQASGQAPAQASGSAPDPGATAYPVASNPEHGAWNHDTGWPAPAPATSHAATRSEPRPERRGPGWGAVVGIALAAALVAGLLGGLVGGVFGGRADLLPDQLAGDLPTPGRGATERPEGSVANIAANALPSVVTIQVDGADGTGTGSGFVADDQGHIITNNHVIASAADEGTIAVQLSNGDQIEATIVGRDSSYDLAVIKVEQSGLKALPIGSSSDVVVGDQVIAVGAPLGLDSTVTEGIISALNRPVSPGGESGQSFINAIQTDAAINPGNSGGPLLNMAGEVIGVNSAIARIPGAGDSQSGNIGVGFSIPSDQVRKTVDQLIATGKAEHPIIGVLLDTEFEGEGARVSPEAINGQEPITADGPADEAGIQPGDVITAFEGRRIVDSDDLVVSIRARDVGDQVKLTVQRDGQPIELTMTLQGQSGN